ncbi:MAG: S-layer homology domain-containing protein [Clostridiales bacterium]|jgi:hypothetical protein|nr:S-layer homology domain-containing protein [Clostridiales bacterium]
MKKMKKTLWSVLLIGSLVFGIGFPAAAFGFTDTDGTKYETAANVLSALGFASGYEDGVFDVGAPMTRAELAAALARLANLTEIDSGQMFFYDVPQTHWARNAIHNTAAHGIMAGEGKYFRPDDNVSLAEVSRGVVTLLGYKRAAGETAYDAVAAQLGIYKNVTVGDYVTRGDILTVLYNALSVDLSVLSGIIGGNAESKVARGKNLLGENFSIYKARGQVTAAGGLDLLRAASANRGYVRIDDTLYRLGGGVTLDASALARGVEFYYRADAEGEEPELLYCVFDRNDEIVEIAADEINSADSGISRISYYSETGRETTREIASGARFIVNGRLIHDADKNDDLFHIDSGAVRLVFPKNDLHPLVWIESYQYYLISGVGTTSVNVKGGGSIDLDPEKEGFEVAIYGRSGEAGSIGDIIKNSAVAVADVTAEDGVTYRSVYLLKTIAGTVTEFGSDGITIGDTRYEILNSLSVSGLKLGFSYTFVISAEGKIALYDSGEEAAIFYGYLVALGLDERGVDHTVEFLILNANNEKKLYRAADTLYVNNVKMKSADFSLSVSNPLLLNFYTTEYDPGTPVFYRRVIAYAANDEGRIERLYTADADPDVLKLDVPPVRRRCKTGAIFNFEGQLTSRATGVIFAAPPVSLIAQGGSFVQRNAEQYLDWLRETQDDPEVWPEAYFTNDAFYTVEGYNTNDLFEAEVILITESTDQPVYNENNTYTCVFDKRGEVVTEEGETAYAITYWQQGTKYTRQIAVRDSKSSYEGICKEALGLRRGDCFKVELTTDGTKIKNLAKEFTQADRMSPMANYNNGRTMLYGQIQAVGINSVVIKPYENTPATGYLSSTAPATLFTNARRVSTYVYLGDHREIQHVPNCLAEARVGDWVLYQARSEAARVMVIFRDDSRLPTGAPILP